MKCGKYAADPRMVRRSQEMRRTYFEGEYVMYGENAVTVGPVTHGRYRKSFTWRKGMRSLREVID